MSDRTYILKKDCPDIGKEIGDVYNHEYAESLDTLIGKGIIEVEKTEEEKLFT